MNEQEIANLVVRLIGDPSSFLKMLVESEAQAKRTEQEVRTLMERIEGFVGKMEGLGSQVEHVLKLFGAGFSLREAFGAFAKAESEELKLTAAVEANGGAVEELMATYKEYAAQVQETTTLNHVGALSLVRMASMYDLAGDAAIAAATKAMQFAGAVDGTAQSASSYIRIAAAMEKGDIALAMRMARLVPQLRGIKDETEFLEKAYKLLNAGQATLQKEAQSAEGQLRQLKNSFEDVLESLGKLVAQGMAPGVKWAKALVGALGEMPEWMQKAVVLLAASVLGWQAFLVLRAPILSMYASIKAAALSAWATTSIQAWTVAAAGAVVVVAAIALAYAATARAARDYVEATEKAIAAQKALQGAIGRSADGGLERLSRLPLDERKAALQADIKMLEEQLKSSREDLAQRKKDFEGRLNTQVTDIVRPGLVAKRREGFAAEAATIDKMSEALARYRAELKSLAESGLSKELADAFKSAKDEAYLAFEAAGRTANEMKLRKLELEGLPQKQLDDLQKVMRLSEGREFMKQFDTEQDKLAAKLEHLDFMFAAGAVTIDEYNYAMERLTRTTKALVAVQAVEGGSMADLQQEAKYREYLESARNPRPKDQKPPLLGEPGVPKLLEEIRDSIRNGLKKKAVIDAADLVD